MIPITGLSWQTLSWQGLLKNAVSDVKELCELLDLSVQRHFSDFPLMVPLPYLARFTQSLLDLLRRARLNVVIVNHINHAQEIDQDVGLAMAALKECGVTLLNQSVLLAGINDSAASLLKLSKRMFSVGALPYYLHLLDPVNGASHFDVNDKKGLQLIEEMQNLLPAYLVPKLVREVPAMPSKQAIT